MRASRRGRFKRRLIARPQIFDEFRHEPSSTDRWEFIGVAADGAWGVYAGLTLHPARGEAWWWTVVAQADAPLLLVRDHSLAMPKPGSFEVRGSGLWADIYCHEPMQRWQVNFEGFAVALDPSDVGGVEHGDRVPIEYEFEWDAIGPPTSTARRGYEQICMVDGEARIGPGGPVLAFAEPVVGRRSHTW